MVLVKEQGGSRAHALINHFIPTIEGDIGICYTYPRNLPGEIDTHTHTHTHSHSHTIMYICCHNYVSTTSLGVYMICDITNQVYFTVDINKNLDLCNVTYMYT